MKDKAPQIEASYEQELGDLGGIEEPFFDSFDDVSTEINHEDMEEFSGTLLLASPHRHFMNCSLRYYEP